MEQKLNEILMRSFEVFLKCGFKSVTMDDVAKSLRMSKKTLYQYVKDKNDLVYKVMEFGRDMDQTAIEMIRSSGYNAIDESYEISKFVLSKVKNMHPSLFFDLEKYYPEAWGIMEQHKEGYICDCVLRNLKKGISEGLYRNNLNAEFVATMHMHIMDMLFHMHSEHPEIKLGFDEMYVEMFRYHIRGIASDKGREYLKEKIKKELY